jgi:chromosome segregation ATPase
MLHRE